MTLRLTTTRTHLFPGAVVRLSGDGACGLIEFADGVAAPCALAAEVLSVAAHVTAAGAAIPERRWRIAVEGAAFRVLRRDG
ncbi:MAG: hypothetical protein EA355_07760 [Rhodobacteraceae bacterium]|nr:MAG: hypothetical protein EA355_07760 [Paracoccaceae bacterium]